MSTNFNFVQYAGDNSGSYSRTLTNTAGNIIVAFVDAVYAASIDTQGPSTLVTDTQGNQYYCVQAEPTPGNFKFLIYVAVHVKAGVNTITYNGTGAYNFVVAECSSVDPNYFFCPGGAEVPNASGQINNTLTSFGGGTGTTFTSSSEVMVIWGIGVGAAPVTAATGTIRAQFSGYGLEYFAFGDENLSSLASYSNTILAGGNPVGVRCCVFLNLIGTCPGVAPPITTLAISCASPPAGTTGVAYSHAFPATGGVTPYTFSISVGSLPTGLTLNTSTGVVSGTPTGTGTSSFTVEVTDAMSSTATAPCSITISAPALAISCGSPPNAILGVSYSHAFPAVNGTPPYTFSITSGSLPPGMTFNTATGTASGTPTALGAYPITVKVTDSTSATASVPCSVSVVAPTTYANGYTLALGSKLTDDDYGLIQPYYVTYFSPTFEQAEANKLGSRNQLVYVAAYVSAPPILVGGCKMNITFLCDTLTNQWALGVQRTILPNPKFDLECAGGNAVGQRIAVKFSSTPITGTDNGFILSRLILWFKVARLNVRGSAT